MTLASMTGFARAAGSAGPWCLALELKAVNAKGLDARLRLAPPFDAIEPDARARLSRKLNRGTIHAMLAAQRDAAIPEVRINQDLLRELIAALVQILLPDRIAPATLDGLLGVRGVMDIADAALDSLITMRQSEGAALASVLLARLEKIAALTQAADQCPARLPEAIKARLAQPLAFLAGNTNFDQNRLHQEALMLAAKADIREELDRLAAHTAAARDLLAKGGAVGRRLDFLAQKFSREANTLCAKARPRIARRDRAIPRAGTKYRVENVMPLENHFAKEETAPARKPPLGRRGLMLILSSPSGAGKTTLTRMLLQTRELDLTLSISVTTRARRSSEVDGIHYSFITKKEFEQLRDGGDLLEWAEVHGNFYGTPREPAEQILRQGHDVLFDIDYQGTRQVKENSGGDAVAIFILPPSMRELQSRLERRAEDRPDVIAKRLNEARNEIRRWTDYDYVLVNDDLQSTFRELCAILAAEHRRTVRAREGIAAFVEKLLGET